MMLRDASRAEEVTQDVFLKVWRALPSYDRGASLSTWVSTIARNTCLSAVRSESYRRTTCREVPEYILESFEELPSAAIQAGIDAHLLGCEGCARFARVQRMLDAGLSTMLVPPAMSPVFRLVLRDRIGREATSPRLDALPDIVHFASFGSRHWSVRRYCP